MRGYQEPSGARHRQTVPDSPPGLNIQEQDRTGQPSGAKQTGTGQDRTAHRNQKPFWAGLEAEASSGHDQESEALTGSLSDRPPYQRQGGQAAKWPPWPLNKEPPSPDESPWTRQDKVN